MSHSKTLTAAQKKDLLIEWNLYSESQKAPILLEFSNSCNDTYSQDDFLEFLRYKLQIDGYWKKVGIL
ncbi:hypothetical protein [Desulforhopalus sp. 52FAK]